jgi:hypothetical protein
MDHSHTLLWRSVFGYVPFKTHRNICLSISQFIFDGEGETSASENVFQFWNFLFSHNISHEGVICRLFTVTFVGQVKSWCETLSVASIHTWEQFMHEF